MLMKEYLRMAIDSIRSNKMRALLTMLGIIIGIASVITIIAAGDGVRAYMNSQLEAVGTNTVIISVDTEEGSENDLITNEDIEALLENEMVRLPRPSSRDMAPAASANPPSWPPSTAVPKAWKPPMASAW